MSSSTVIAFIIVLLIALVSYAFVSQTLERKRKQRQRLLTGLKQRWKDFKYMASGFPEGFLPKELYLLVHRSLIDICEQLIALEPKTKEYTNALSVYTQQYQNIQSRPPLQGRVSLDNPQQIQEIKTLLQGLNGFVNSQHKRGRLSAAQHSQYEQQIRQLVAQVTVDTYLISAKQAAGQEKLRLAIHYFLLAKKLLIKEDASTNHHEQIQSIDEKLRLLEQQLTEQDQLAPQATKPDTQESVSNEWDEFTNETSDGWKKKAIYD